MPTFRVCCAALLTCLGASPLVGQARHFRIMDGRDGLTPAVVTALAQDRDGLLWIGTAGGLHRYDGTRFERWAPDRLDTWVAAITVSPTGEVVVIDEKQGGLLEIEGSGVREVIGPRGALRGAGWAVFDRTGGLWVSQGPELMRRDPNSGQWQRVPLDTVDGTAPRTLVALSGPEILVATRKAVWRARPGRVPEWLADIPNIVNGLVLSDGRILGLTFDGSLVEFGERVTRSPPIGTGRGIAVAERNGTLWVSFDRSLVAVSSTGTTDTLAAAEGISGSGPLLVDHEGSLWMGSWNGLFHFPEPDTRVWGAAQGLPSDHVVFIDRVADAFLVNTWQGPGFIRPRFGGWTAMPMQSPGAGFNGWYQVDRTGRIWTGSPGGILRLDGGRSKVAWPHPAILRSLAEDASGSLYIATNRGLLTADSLDGALRRVTGLPLSSDSANVDRALIDRLGRLWIAGEGRVCAQDRGLAPRARLTALRSPPEGESLRVAKRNGTKWWCRDAPANSPITALVQAASGTLWMALERRGVLRLRDEGWEAIAGVRGLPNVNVANVVASPAGGFWLVGAGMVLRVVEDTMSDDGWRVVERVTGWHGLPQSSAADVFEEPDGTLWIATMLGVVRVPAEVRRSRPAPPRVLLVDGSVDEDRIGLDGDLRLPFERNRLRLRFAAVSFRDPSLLRYQVRAGSDHAWETVGGTPEFRWVDLEPGRYRAEVRASLDGQHWSVTPAGFDFRVQLPWYRTYWALTVFASIVVGIGLLIHRARVAVHVELERQRVRIAMDLHDELGSGLGSIGILAGVLRSSPADAPTRDLRQVAGEIGSTAAALGAALSDIVWALDRRSGGLDAIASRLAEHGNRLFPNGAARFTTRFPTSWPNARLDLATRRNILMIGVEALHNAARHSGASSVELSVDAGPTGWTLQVIDHGVGLAAQALTRNGMGLASMRRRAQQIGAQLHWLPAPGGGTIVRVRIRTAGPHRVRFSWQRPWQRPWQRWYARLRARPPA